MDASTIARSLPANAARRWRSLGLRTRVALGLLLAALAGIAWWSAGVPSGRWTPRAVVTLPPKGWPLMFSPDGRTLLSTGEGGITPLDIATGRGGVPWAAKEGLFVVRGAFSPDGRAFAAAIVHHPSLASIDLIDPGTGRTRTTLTTNHPIVYQMAFVDGGATLRAILGDSSALKEAVTWDVATGRQASTRPLSSKIRGSYHAFSPDGRLLAFIPWRSAAVQFWDLETDRAIGGLTNPVRPGLVGHGIDFSADGRTLAVARHDGAIDLWDVPARSLLKTLPAHARGFVSTVLRFSPDGRTIVSTAGEESGAMMAIHQAYSDVRRKITGLGLGSRSEMIVIDVAAGRRIVQTDSDYDPFFTPDGRALATTDGRVVGLHDLPSGPNDQEPRP